MQLGTIQEACMTSKEITHASVMAYRDAMCAEGYAGSLCRRCVYQITLNDKHKQPLAILIGGK